MPLAPRERSPKERETLIYKTPEQAQEFREAMSERLVLERQSGVQRNREVIAEALADEFAVSGDPVSIIKHPWEHTAAEHAEAQQLVDVAFAHDLPAALRQARASEHFPRVLDLFHDVLTNEMYDLVAHEKLDRQGLAGWSLIVFIVLAVAVGLALLLLIFT